MPEWFLLGGRILLFDNAGGNDFGRLLGHQSPDCVGDGSKASETTDRGTGASDLESDSGRTKKKKVQLL